MSNGPNNASWKGTLLAGATVVISAALSGVAAYVATWNIEAQKIELEGAQGLEQDFQAELTKILIGAREFMVEYAETGKVDGASRKELMKAILNMHVLFHPKTGRWPSKYEADGKEIVNILVSYREMIQKAESRGEIEGANEIFYALLDKKDKLFTKMRNDTQLSIWRFVPLSS
ncbi:hypothetical protein [Azospirillum himalayense]|uniref:Uncharacterized protein n=1 Tax=Azospirillum himalayense TaxID=654847 RepID=A0ABW0G3Y5_9PROT